MAVCFMPPPLAFTVMACVPVGAPFATLIVIVEVPAPGAAMEEGLKVTVTPLPCPEAPKAIVELKSPAIVVVIVVVPDFPLTMLTELGDALIEKFGGPVTVRVTVVVSVMVPEVPVTVMGYTPVTVDAATVIVIVEVPSPVIEVGLKATVTPFGWPVADKLTAESKPPVTELIMLDVPDVPCANVTAAGEENSVKPGAPEPPASELIKPLPFGLPQPVARS